MSDLGGGRTSNGGPVPVSSASSVPAGLKTPRDVMRDRRAREARRVEEAKLEDQRRRQQEDERRKSAERRALAATGGARASAASSQYTPDISAQQGAFAGSRLSGSGQVASSADYGAPTGRADATYSSQGRRSTGTSQAQDQPRPAPTAASSSRRAQSAQPKQAAQPQPSSAPPEQPAAEPRASTFPHAFERWEQLSSHWEGLTSYWLKRLDADAEEISRTVPSAAAMSRQITDLSAAGANLFHAVVELQRLRASSERKFQRWFFETRADTERDREVKAQLEQQLQAERAERQRAAKERVDIDIAAENARREVAEMRRELMISKEEARRAWEELGRRNQETLELAESLKAGKMTIVSGMQVLPIFSGPSRTASASQRPATRDGASQFDATPGINTAGAAGLRSPADDDYYDQAESPTNTDPFTEGRQQLHHEPGVSSLATGTYQPSFHATSGPLPSQPAYGSPSQRPSSAGQQATPRATQQHLPVTTADDPEHFYQQAHHDPQSRTPVTAQRRQPQPVARHDEHDLNSESEDWEAEADTQRQRELADRYGLGGAAHPTALTQIPPEAPTVPATSAAAMATYGPTVVEPHGAATLGAEPDYEGSGYDGWENLGARSTHHPTRLSDVLEEEEERSSRRTAE
ncbi:hypothetical protein AMS68_004825 [Peltaster fructicola]|uniref:Uncharacterized protein n=1 Tax=Peltaster fructicola TaxID=286661 RepID=A0A6H0XXI9_9PEZI|nr:hypothetical protein AMS68_004825 [Peltaster fructicola]